MIAVMNIMEKFDLSSGTTILACKGYNPNIDVIGKKFRLIRGDEVRQILTISGEQEMLNRKLKIDQRAFETRDTVLLSFDEARSGDWQLIEN